MRPTLFLLAAGMGSRYGGLKQLDGVGPHGETIMDYSIYDAVRAGYGKLVFVIREDFDTPFREKVLSRYQDHIATAVVYQSITALPYGFRAPEGRQKPWGTNHAVLMGLGEIFEPFAVINCDDFYGAESFRVMGQWLSSLPDDSHDTYAMMGYSVGNTLSDSGTVSRGICSTNAEGLLTSIVERTSIRRTPEGAAYQEEDGTWHPIPATTPVSMNFWGFTPDYLYHSEEGFRRFLRQPETQANPKREFFIPLMVDQLISSGTSTVRVLDTPSQWFGVTYPEDRPAVVAKLRALTEAGVYPERLFP